MKSLLGCSLVSILTLTQGVQAASTGEPFYGDPPNDTHPWAVHDWNRPQPKIVTPGTFSTADQPGRPPSDAIVLFDGSNLDKWEADSGEGVPTKWVIKNGAMECVPGSGYIRTREKFGDCQLHVEWTAPTKIIGESQGRGNSGVFLMGLIEIQVLDNYNNPTYADGMAASIYGVNPPMANGLRPPGEFQTYDIVFRRPVYRDGKQIDPGYVTVFENGILVQDHTPLEGGTGHMVRTKPGPMPEVGPLKLQDHGNPVRYRNVWYRPLPPRTVEGGIDGGLLSADTATAKRKEIAAGIRQDAAKLKDSAHPVPEMLRLGESLVYEKDETAFKQFSQMANDYVASLKSMSPADLGGKKDEATHVLRDFKYLATWKVVPGDFAPNVALDEISKAQGWNKRK